MAPAPGGVLERMNRRTLLWLAGGALLALAVAWLLERDSERRAPGQVLLPGLDREIAAVSTLRVEPAGGEAFRIERGPEGWLAPAREGYRADAVLVRRILVNLSEARIREPKTENPDLHHRLGVETIDGRPGSGVLLGIEGLATPLELVVGQRETRGLRGTYVRRAGEPRAYLVDRDLQLAREPVDWLERDILDISPQAVAAIRITRADGEELLIDRDELGIFRIANLPEGRRPSGPTAAEAVARGLAGLRLDDVIAVGEDSPGRPAAVATFRLSDGLVIEARTREALSLARGADNWVGFAVRYEPGDGEHDPGVAAEAAALHERLSPWLYRLPAWRHEQLARRLSDLLAAEGPPAE